MDRLIYTALSGMQASMDRQRAIASNMANTNTLGFRAELIEQRAKTIEGHPNEARAMQTARVTGADMSGGEIIETATFRFRRQDCSSRGKATRCWGTRDRSRSHRVAASPFRKTAP